MDDSTQVVVGGTYNRYWDKAELTEPIFHLFLTSPDRTDSMPSVHEKTGVPLTALYC
jgi:hypothetical protein